MKKIYQSQWQGINFEGIWPISSTELAGEDFYKSFYREFFKRYESAEDIEPEWLQLKHQIGDFLVSKIPEGKESKILSIGCGLGIIEQVLINEGYHNLELLEVSEDCLRWIKTKVPEDKLHIGFFPHCLCNDSKYDVIYLCAVEYIFDQLQFINLLRDIKERLNPGGQCIIVSHSFYEETPIRSGIIRIKDIMRLLRNTSKISP